jgi:hypothetical protein
MYCCALAARHKREGTPLCFLELESTVLMGVHAVSVVGLDNHWLRFTYFLARHHLGLEFAPLFRPSESVTARIAVGCAKESRQQRYILPPTLGPAVSYTGQRIIKSQLKIKYWWLMSIPTRISPVVCPAQIRGRTDPQFGLETMMIIPHLCCHGDRNRTVWATQFLEAVILATAPKRPSYNQEISKVR